MSFDKIDFVSYGQAVDVISRYHYSKVLPRITRFCIGGFVDGKVEAVCTLGYGVRPLHTIKRAFPSLGVKDYLEIGKLCLADVLPRNSESTFIAGIIQLLKHHFPTIKILYTWADGIIGKPGYVYQASNFFYGGYIWTEMYLDAQGIRVHPRTMQGLSETASSGHFNSRAYDVTIKMGFTKYFGLQFRYCYPLCHKHEWKNIIAGSPFTWERGAYPKTDDCKWMVQTAKGARSICDKPPFTITDYKVKNNAQIALF